MTRMVLAVVGLPSWLEDNSTRELKKERETLSLTPKETEEGRGLN